MMIRMVDTGTDSRVTTEGSVAGKATSAVDSASVPEAGVLFTGELAFGPVVEWSVLRRGRIRPTGRRS